MFRSFIGWLDLYLSRETPASVLKSLVGLMAFAGLLGTILGNQAIRVGAFVVVIVFVISVILLLLADRRRLQNNLRVTRQLLTRYCDWIIENSGTPLVEIETWDQTVYVQPNGDVTEVISIEVIALRDRVNFLRLTAGSLWDQPERFRPSVKVVARSLTADNTAGPRWIVTTSWSSSQKLVTVLHPHEPIKEGEQLRLEMTRTWPAKCRPLMRDGAAESFIFRVSKRLNTRKVRYRIVLPHGTDAVHEPIGHMEPDIHLSIENDRDREGRRVFTFDAAPVPPEKAVGIRLELSGSRL